MWKEHKSGGGRMENHEETSTNTSGKWLLKWWNTRDGSVHSMKVQILQLLIKPEEKKHEQFTSPMAGTLQLSLHVAR